MTIQVEVQCDADGCHNSVEIEGTYDSDVTREGWHVHPNDGYQHYCPACWPKVKAELEEMEED